MRSLFWRILATFWLAIALVAGLAMLLGHALNQDAWILSRHPAVKHLAVDWTAVYEQHGPLAAQAFLDIVHALQQARCEQGKTLLLAMHGEEFGGQVDHVVTQDALDAIGDAIFQPHQRVVLHALVQR